jgi:hypothetical protein
MSLMSVPSGALDAIDFLQSGGVEDLVGNLLPGQNKKSLSTVYTKQGTKTDGQNFDKIDSGSKLEPIH